MIHNCVTFAGTRVDQAVAVAASKRSVHLGFRQRSMLCGAESEPDPMKSASPLSLHWRRHATKQAVSSGSIRH